MTWNWQKNDWPNFTWDASRLLQAERQFLVGGGLTLALRRTFGRLRSAT